MTLLVILLLAYIFQIGSVLLLEFRHPDKALAWMFILFLVPVIGFMFYFFLAQDYRKRKKLRYSGAGQLQDVKTKLSEQSLIVKSVHELHNTDFQRYERLYGLLSHFPESPITGNNETRVLSEGETAFAAMLAEMEKAKHHIHIEFYIFRADGIGTVFQEVMIRKAREGVKVRLLCDGLGSHQLPSSFVHLLQKEGVEVYFFLPPFLATLDRRVNYRNHRKILVVDGTVGFLGGLNVGDDYLGLYEKMGYWRDTHLQLNGDSAYYLQKAFIENWQSASGQKIYAPELFPAHRCKQSEQVQILASGPNQQGNDIQKMYFGAIAAAKQRVWITSPYFIPDQGIFTALRTAALSGVEVLVIIPDRPDSRFVKLASLSYVEELMTAGVKFYQYKKGFIHAKVLIIDNLLASVGTANMDMRSFYYNFEITALMFDREAIIKLTKDFEEDVSESIPIHLPEFSRRSRLQKGAEIVARLLAPLL
ncbi:cardiolipin synthase [Paenibacillus puldeungensis]|uniref:Cardiolipin synthase n=1 Tax=Paenibacillus puldeungensis TaxID=696536 RepID=A0ABW3RRU8_9BACL